ncbi:hypothetical protein BC937DRAFT_90455 [Endogone sp. FLAS-F59071]|nr:hypothetical protein BC937DRAFT_90455 [Endogone sp. FLAS-F59071]|eukprot:RUS17077.1 hypothetical protein BC937DRAFT_90455 [Endogone sp. FLAS-F59071]
MPQAKPELTWSHEQASEMMLEYLIDDNNIDLEKDEIELIKGLIDGKPGSKCRHSQRGFLFDIVANKRNSVDVDKFDYIERDCYNLGIKSSYDTSRLMAMCRVVNNQICFHHKEVYSLYDMFHTRYSLFKRIYTHRVCKAIEYMITDVLLAADPYIHISNAVQQAEQYVNLTDDILRVIERSSVDELAPARAIIKRIRTRQLYKFVDEVLIPQDMKLYLTKDKINPREIIAYQNDNDQLIEEDVIVQWLRINYAFQDRNPVDMIQFYSKFNENESFHIAKEQVSYLVPEQFEETVVRVFSRDMKKVKAIQMSFRKLMRTYLNFTPNIAHTLPSGFESQKKQKILNMNS